MLLLEELSILNEERAFFESLNAELFENLGKLGVVDKKLLKILKGKKYYGSKTNVVRDALGQNSSVLTRQVANQNKAWDLFDEPNNVVLVLKIGDDQILAIIDDAKANNKTGYDIKPTYQIIANPELFSKYVPEKEYEQTVGGMSHGWTSNDFRIDSLRHGAETAKAMRVKKIMKVVFDAAKKADKHVDVMVVGKDLQRLKTRKERAEGRVGTEITNPGNRMTVKTNGGYKWMSDPGQLKKFYTEIRKSLKDRLDDFKSATAEKFDTAEEMLASMVKNGIFEKFSIGSGEYDIRNERVYIHSLLKKAKAKKQGKELSSWDNQDDYVEFELREKPGDRYRKISELYKKVKAEHPDADQETVDAALSKAAKTAGIPPIRVRVVFGMDGGKIVPTAVKEFSYM